MQQVQTPGWEGSSPDSARMNLSGTLEAPSHSAPRALHLQMTVVRLTTQLAAPIRICKALGYELKFVSPTPPPPNSPNSHLEILTQGDGFRRWGLGEERASWEWPPH